MNSPGRSLAQHPLLKSAWPFLAIGAAWAATFLVIWPHGDFTLNDDFGYSTPVEWWVKEGRLEFTFWQGMTLIAQIWLGVLWTKLLGFDLTTLRLLTVLISFFASCAAFALARECGLAKWLSLAIALVLFAYPPFLSTSASFMTDTYFQLFALLSLYYFSRTLNGAPSKTPAYSLALIFMIAAILVRQTGAALAVGYLVGVGVAGGERWGILVRSGVAVVVGFGLALWYPDLVASFAELPPQYFHRSAELKMVVTDLLDFRLGVLIPVATVFFKGVLYFGLIFLPLAIGVAAARISSREFGVRHAAVIIGVAAALCVVAAVSGVWIPLAGNTLSTEGVGPRAIDPSSAQGEFGAVWIALNIAAALSIGIAAVEAGAPLLKMVRQRTIGERQRVGRILMLLTTAAIVYLPYGVGYSPFFDRYLIFPSVPVIIALGMLADWGGLSQKAIAPVFAVIAVGVLISSIMTRDFFTWSRARADITAEAIEAFDLTPSMIDGGFEFNNYQRLLHSSRETRPTETIFDGAERRYRIAKAPMPGYEIVLTRTAGQILPLGSDTIYVLRR